MAVDLEEKDPIPSVKDLASSEPSLRRKNLQQLITHLELRPASHYLSHTQALKLWRGFHVALYMHDSKNQLSVQSLITTLADTFDIIRAKDIELALSETTPNSRNDTSRTAKLTSSAEEGVEFSSTDAEDDFTGFDDDNNDNTLPSTNASSTPTWLSTYTSAFWETIAREWSGIDQWRINKYLLLTRVVLRKTFQISLSAYFGTEQSNTSPASPDTTSRKRKPVSTATPTSKKQKPNPSSPPPPPPQLQPKSSNGRDTTVLNTTLTLLSSHPLSPRSRTVSDGLRLHVLDIYVDELFSSSSSSTPVPTDPDPMRPVRALEKEALAKHVRRRAGEVLTEFEERAGTGTGAD